MFRNVRNCVPNDMASYSRRRNPQIKYKLYTGPLLTDPVVSYGALDVHNKPGAGCFARLVRWRVFLWAEWINLRVLLRKK